jgi:hypothetical protein
MSTAMQELRCDDSDSSSAAAQRTVRVHALKIYGTLAAGSTYVRHQQPAKEPGKPGTVTTVTVTVTTAVLLHIVPPVSPWAGLGREALSGAGAGDSCSKHPNISSGSQQHLQHVTRFEVPFPCFVVCRDFIMGSYAEMKKANPDFPILVREASGTEAKLIARYGECTTHRDDGCSRIFSQNRGTWTFNSCLQLQRLAQLAALS